MADIYINYGDDPFQMTIELMKRAAVAKRIPFGARICVKPNLLMARPSWEGATTHPEIVEGILCYLLEHGHTDITIAEGAWVGDSTKRAFERCGYNALAKKHHIKLVDTKEDAVVYKASQGLELGLCRSVVEADFLINVPVLKGHCQTGMTCCLKNLKGCIPDSEKRRYHTMGLHKPIAALNTVLKPSLNIVDSICGDLNFEEGGNPVDSGRVLLGWNSVLLDSYCAGLLGYHPEEIIHLRLAREYGAGAFANSTTEVVELNATRKPIAPMVRSGAAKRLAAHIEEDSACSACFAALLYALEKSGGSHFLKGKIKIGQGFQGKSCAGVGVGNCTSGCSQSLPGCPPRAVDIVRFLQSL